MFQGKPPILFMASRCAVACSSDWPPERKAMPGTGDGDATFEDHDGTLGHLLDGDLAGTFLARHDHVRLENAAFENDTLLVELLIDRLEAPIR